MFAYVIERCSAVTARSTHFIEAVNEEGFVSVFGFRIESGEVPRLDVFAARFLRFSLKGFGLACTRITKQHIGDQVAIFMQWATDRFLTTLHDTRAGARDDE